MFDGWPSNCRIIADRLKPMLCQHGADFRAVDVPKQVRVGWMSNGGKRNPWVALLTWAQGGSVDLKLRVSRDSGFVGPGLPLKPSPDTSSESERDTGSIRLSSSFPAELPAWIENAFQHCVIRYGIELDQQAFSPNGGLHDKVRGEENSNVMTSSMKITPEIDERGQRLLVLLVDKLPRIVSNDPKTFVSYKDVHDELGLPLLRSTYGESLKAQGLSSLADWTASSGKPGITGIIIDRGSMMPGDGYFKLFGKKSDDFPWWASEVERSKRFDWSPYIPVVESPAPPVAIDIAEPPVRQETTTYRIIRDSILARRVKQMHKYECQLCGHTIQLPDGARYAEAHHVRPLGDPHNGPDHIENIICLCPNHHAELDYGVRALDTVEIRSVQGHSIDNKYINYHNVVVWKKL
jgi:HNH endonuclease